MPTFAELMAETLGNFKPLENLPPPSAPQPTGRSAPSRNTAASRQGFELADAGYSASDIDRILTDPSFTVGGDGGGWTTNAQGNYVPDGTGETGPALEDESGDKLDQGIDRFFEEMGPLFDEYRELGELNSAALQGIGEQYGEDLRGMPLYGGLRDLYEAGGLTDQTRLGLEQSRRDAEQTMRSSREAMLADLAERGMQSGGLEVASAAADRASARDAQSMRDLETRSFAQQQALQALQGMGEIDADVAVTQKGLAETGARNQFDLSRGVLDTGRSAISELFGDMWGRSNSLHDTLVGGVFPAANAAAGGIAGGSGTSGAAGALGGMGSQLGSFGGGLVGFSGTPAPSPSTTMPVSSGNPGPGGSFDNAGADLIGGLVGAGRGIADAYRDDDESVGKVGAGGNGVWGS